MTHETLNKVVVVTAISAPWWVEPLRQVSEIASYAMPILGLIFLIAQMIVWFRKQRKPS